VVATGKVELRFLPITLAFGQNRFPLIINGASTLYGLDMLAIPNSLPIPADLLSVFWGKINDKLVIGVGHFEEGTAQGMDKCVSKRCAKFVINRSTSAQG